MTDTANFTAARATYLTARGAATEAEAELSTLIARSADLAADLSAARAAATEAEADLTKARNSYLCANSDAEAVHTAQGRLDQLRDRHRHLAELAGALNGEITDARIRADRARREANRAREIAFRALRGQLILDLPEAVVEDILDLAVADENPPMARHEYHRAIEWLLDRHALSDIRQVSARRAELGRRHGLD